MNREKGVSEKGLIRVREILMAHIRVRNKNGEGEREREMKRMSGA